MAQGQLTLTQYFLVTWRWVLLAVTTLALYVGVVRPLAVAPFLVMAFVLLTPLRARIQESKSLWLTVLALASGSLIFSQFLRYTEALDVVSILLEVVTCFLPFTLLTPERPRSYWLSALNVTVIAVGSISLKGDIVSYSLFLSCLVLLLFNINSANIFHLVAHRRGPEDTLPPRYFTQFVSVVPIGALAAAIIFFSFPRVRSIPWTHGNWLRGQATGYSDSITLSGSGPIDTSQELAFIVESEIPKDKEWLRRNSMQLLFRGDALDHYDKGQWKRTFFDLFEDTTRRDLRLTTNYESGFRDVTIYQEPSSHDTLFYPGTLFTAQIVRPRRVKMLFRETGGLVRNPIDGRRVVYKLKFGFPDLNAPFPADQVSDLKGQYVKVGDDEIHNIRALTPEQYEHYTKVPNTLSEAPYFQDWLSEVGLNETNLTMRLALNRLQQHFVDHYEWTLDNQFSDEDTMKAFLTMDKRGHCEYFAAASVLALRSVGLPARVAVGYRGGVWNDVAEVLEVRQSSAHAWVEVLHPDVGWLPVDTTPGGFIAPGTGLLGTWQRFSNAASFWMHRYVIDYNIQTQRDIVKTALGINGNLLTGDVDRKQLVQRLLMWGAVPVGLLLSYLLWVLWRRRERIDLPDYYRMFERRVGAHGHSRRAGETFAQFHTRIVAAGYDQGIVDQVDQQLERDLYRPPQAGQEPDLTELKAAIKLLKKAA